MVFGMSTFNSLLLSVTALSMTGMLVYTGIAMIRKYREQRNIDRIIATIIEYFRKTGVEVSAGCTRFQRAPAYTAVIESEPMKQFRLSHIIEMTLRDHIRKSCGLELDKIYWRFPIKEAVRNTVMQEAGTTSVPAENSADDYINEGLEHYKYIPKMEATELSWEHFEKVATGEPQHKENP